jgi:hypothetical protein
MIDRRTVLMALAALGSGAGASAAALPGLDAEAGRRIGEAWRAAHPGAGAGVLAADLTPAGLQKLRGRVAADFRAGRVWVHKGWRISDTEGRLFALLAS